MTTIDSTDNGVTPIEYLLVGLGSCLTAGVASVAQNRGIQLRSVEARLEGAHDIRGILGADSDVRNGYNGITVTFTIDAEASKEDIEALVAQPQKRSAVFDALTSCSNAARSRTPGGGNAGTRCGCSPPTGRAGCRDTTTTARTPTAT